jgi:uncharacterized protein YfaS (alpha-2-macroglobulin family)
MRIGLVARLVLFFSLAIVTIAHSTAAMAGERRVIRSVDADYFGFDYRTVEEVTLDECTAACVKDDTCRAFTYNVKARYCFLKSDHGELKAFAGAVAGRVVETEPAQKPAGEAKALTFLPEGVADAAIRYRNSLEALAGQQTLGAVELAQRARAAVVVGDPRGAAEALKGAISLAPGDPALWADLTQALAAVEAGDSSERYRLPIEITSAALNAYQMSQTVEARAAVLAQLARALEARAYFRPAIEAYKASLELDRVASVVDAYTDLKARKGFRVIDHTVDSNSLSPRVCVQVSDDLVKGARVYQPFVRLNGEAAASLEVEARQICISGVKHGERYRITLRSGLPSIVGEVLEAPVNLDIYVRDRSPAVRFSGDNYVLPRIGSRGIPVTTINTEEVKLELYRVGERGVARLLAGNTFLRQVDGYEQEQLKDDLAERLWQGSLFTRSDLNKEVVTVFPLEEALPDRKPGVYALVAVPAAADSNYWEGRATQWFVVSDIGLSSFMGSDGLTVMARSLSDAKGLEGVELKLVARNNEVLGSLATDAQGVGKFTAGLTRGVAAMAPALLVASRAGEDFVLLDLKRPAFDLSDRGVTGRPAAGALDLFMYTERGIYRAGETVHVAGLLRDQAAMAAPGVPLTFAFQRPDGVEFRRFVAHDGGAGGYAVALGLEANAMRGTWTVKAYADPKGDALADQRFLVEDFVPDRMEFDIRPEAQQVQRGEPFGLEIDGRYLFGAPAADLALEADVRIRAKREFEAYKGFQFGLADQMPEATFEVLQDLPATDGKGVAHVVVAPETLPDWSGPLEATVNIRLREGGGRAVEKAQKITIAPHGAQIGIRPLFAGGAVREGSEAGFEVIAIGADGQRQAAGEVGWSLVRIERDYQWYRGDSGWSYEPVDHARRIADGRIAIGAETPVTITVPVEWGRYRLEVAGDAATSPASSVEFDAGWHVPQASTETPDGLEIALDKAGYVPGETANLKISPRYAGTAIVVTGTDRVIDIRTLVVPRQGTSLALPVTAEWGTGAYVMVTLIRPAAEDESRLPQRAIGIAHAGIDPAARKLAVSIGGAEQARPNGAVSVAVQVSGLAAGKSARVMLAAVDVGILNLTRYEPPRPDDWFFGQQRLGLELRDLYGRLIDATKGIKGAIRTGGDAAGLGMEGSPPTQPLMAYFSGIVTTDAAGKADITFNLPQFNGTVRLMAVAFTEAAVGSASRDMIVRDPIVVVASHPRFLAPGDEARLWLDITNTDADEGEYHLAISASPELSAPLMPGAETFVLKKGVRTSLIVPLIARQSGAGSLAMRLYREGGEEIEQVVAIPVRSPRLPVSQRQVLSLKAKGGSVTLDRDFLAGFEAAGTRLTAAVTRAAGLDVASLLVQLDRYPYGCAEQTTSKAFPLLYLSEVATSMGLGDAAGIRERVQKAVDRVLSFQSSTGSFGLWGPGSDDLWLDAYVSDFLTRAREKGYDVPDLAFAQAIDNLHNALGYDIDLKTDSAKVAYALYVLARNKKASLGDLRYYSDARLGEFSSPMAKAQLAAGLGLYGEADRAQTVFAAAYASLTATASENFNRSDYGSTLRDGAATLALAAESLPAPRLVPDLVRTVSAARLSKATTSTQEQAWLLLAARALIEGGEPLRLDVNGMAATGAFNRVYDGDLLRGGAITVTNEGESDVDMVVSVTGVPDKTPVASGEGFTIERDVYGLDGQARDLDVVGQNERFVVVLKVTEKNAWPSRVLIADLLPAGFEIDNPRIVGSADLKAFDWLPETVPAAHVEFRADRFIAAFDRGASDERAFVLAYMVRAVTPGRYVHPAAQVEDMYRPHLFARTAEGRAEVVGPQQ